MTARFEVVTLFPRLFASPLEETVLARAIREGRIAVRLTDIRAFTFDAHATVDDRPYGGGPGMVMKAEPLVRAVEAASAGQPVSRVVVLSPSGRRFTQRVAEEYAAGCAQGAIVLVCGRYEGIDARVPMILGAEELSLGDFVLTGGELAAMAVIDAVSRLLPGVLGNEASTHEESLSDDLLEYPQLTRPPSYRGLSVPEVLLSGHHGQVKAWRARQSRFRTRARRPDLWARHDEP